MFIGSVFPLILVDILIFILKAWLYMLPKGFSALRFLRKVSTCCFVTGLAGR